MFNDINYYYEWMLSELMLNIIVALLVIYSVFHICNDVESPHYFIDENKTTTKNDMKKTSSDLTLVLAKQLNIFCFSFCQNDHHIDRTNQKYDRRCTIDDRSFLKHHEKIKRKKTINRFAFMQSQMMYWI